MTESMNASIIIVEGSEMEEDVSMSANEEEESEDGEERENETAEVETAPEAPEAPEEEAAAEGVEVTEVTEDAAVTKITAAEAEDAAQAVLPVTEVPKPADVSMVKNTRSKKKPVPVPVYRCLSPIGDEEVQVIPPWHEDKIFQGRPLMITIVSTHHDPVVQRKVMQQKPEGKSIGSVYKMAEMGTGMEPNDAHEKEIIREAIIHIKSQSEYFCDRPGDTTRMEPNTNVVKQIMSNRRDRRKEATMFNPQHQDYLALAIAEIHRRCRHILSMVIYNPNLVCKICRGCFYVEVGYGNTPREKLSEPTPQPQTPAPEESEQQQEATRRRRELIISKQQQTLMKHHKKEERKLQSQLRQEENKRKQQRTDDLKKKHQKEWDELDQIHLNLVQDQDTGTQQDQEQDQDQEDEEEGQ